MAEEKTDLEVLLAGAREHEERYDWTEAAEDYDCILGSMSSREPGKVGDILERKAFALYKSALQAEDIEEFRRVADSASRTYSDAKSALQNSGGEECAAEANRCSAMLALLEFYGSSSGDERREHTRESWTLAKEALAGFEAAKNSHEYRKTFNDLALMAVAYSELVPDFETRKRAFEEAIDAGEKAVEFGRSLEDGRENIRTLTMIWALLGRAATCGLTDRDSRDSYKKALHYLDDARKLSRKNFLAELPFAAFVGDTPVDADRDMVSEGNMFKEALDIVRESRDRFMIGHALVGVSFYAHWTSSASMDSDEMKAGMDLALNSSVEAHNEFSRIGFIGSRGANIWPPTSHADYYAYLARSEADLKSKREYALKALETCEEASKLADGSGYTHQIGAKSLRRSDMLYVLAETENDFDRKRTLIGRAAECCKTGISLLERWEAGNPYNLALYHVSVSEIQGQLAEVEVDTSSRIRALREAIESHRIALEMFTKGAEIQHNENDPGFISGMADSRTTLGRRCASLSELTDSEEASDEAIRCFETSARLYSQIGVPSRSAECHWHAGREYDKLENHEKAAGSFLSAAAGYREGAEAIPRLKSLYSDYATYLDAWGEFERAKHRHVRGEYRQAVSHFKRAAALYESLPKWRFLASNYHAWALLDEAESASREDHTEEAATLFNEAAGLFQKGSMSLEAAGSIVENADEKRMVTRLLSASTRRYGYCKARAEIERARKMDLEGQHSSSSETFSNAANELEQLAESAPSDQDKREMKLIATISRAWQNMTRAEVELSPGFYEDASRLFEEAKDMTWDPKTKALTLGHSRFCRALEAGIRFTDSRDDAFHESAVKHLESASGYYLRAGSDACSEYARASRLLFDAHAYVDDAAKNKDRKGAARAYALADEVLRASAESFNKAGQKAKMEQVHKLRERVKKEKELAVSLMQVLEAPADMSSTMAFIAPAPAQETAAGLDRFLHADVQATVIASPVNLNVGEEFRLEIELVNAGNGVARLTKVEEIVPKGFEIREMPAKCRFEDNCLNMRGRRLNALKTDDIRIVLRPGTKGRFTLKPRILYLDDSGRYRSHEPEPVEVTVKELGISGWLRGADSRR